MSLSDSIKIIRQKTLMNQEDFAAELRVSLASVNRWEVGKSIPNLAAMKSLKTFCEKHNQDYGMVESEWITVRLEAKK